MVRKLYIHDIYIYLITTSTPNSIISISNPVSESTALTITPFSGGTDPVSAHLVILQLFRKIRPYMVLFCYMIEWVNTSDKNNPNKVDRM
jgi:hypothetical protein